MTVLKSYRKKLATLGNVGNLHLALHVQVGQAKGLIRNYQQTLTVHRYLLIIPYKFHTFSDTMCEFISSSLKADFSVPDKYNDTVPLNEIY